ncbi:enoyl-CoA hydratase/isomerase family protein [Ideonella sp. B508-1]|uniref:enoyl-CoA hydratase/isomerase family protein n=1 Tax=Ideonella sp. B508-1 TaxID=137716 RepID=UPI00034A1B34|nr:enoyl-CoA hydratase/isomerase family protein [Ideonella sp. B508-1]
MIKTNVEDGVAEILIDSPPVNGITDPLLTALMNALSEAGADPQIRAIVLGSAIPKRFCGGLDLPRFRTSTPTEIHAIVNKLYYQLYELQSSLPKPVIAAITGAVRGGGMSIAITCDMVVAAEDATFGYPELDVGLLPAIHYTHLPRIVGKPRAFDLLFTGRVFDAHEALALGLIGRVVPSAEVLSEARALARVFAGKSPELMRLGKAAFVRATENGYRQGAGSAVDLVSTVFGTAAGQEGLAAFAEKRKPVWRTA